MKSGGQLIPMASWPYLPRSPPTCQTLWIAPLSHPPSSGCVCLPFSSLPLLCLPPAKHRAPGDQVPLCRRCQNPQSCDSDQAAPGAPSSLASRSLGSSSFSHDPDPGSEPSLPCILLRCTRVRFQKCRTPPSTRDFVWAVSSTPPSSPPSLTPYPGEHPPPQPAPHLSL